MMIKRDMYLKKLLYLKDLKLIKYIKGVYGVGKSTLLLQFQEMLKTSFNVKDEQIISLNFEDLDNEKFLDYKTLYTYLTSKLCNDKHTYIFLDEIQKVPMFEKVVDSLYIKDNVDIYITGSNAFMLSSDLSTYLSGRYIELNLLPLSFKEYLEFMTDYKEESLNSLEISELFTKYLEYGGMPYTALISKKKLGSETKYIEGIYNTVVIKDIELRENNRRRNNNNIEDINVVSSSTSNSPQQRNITDISLLKTISTYLSSVIGSFVSTKSISNYLTSSGIKTSHITVSNYLSALEESYLYYKVDRMDVAGKTLLKQYSKYYLVDLGFRKLLLSKQHYDVGFTLENVVFLELLRRGYKVNVGKVVVNNRNKNGGGGTSTSTTTTEIDFVAFKDGIYEYYQVSSSLLDESTFLREITPLRNVKDNYSKTILTTDIYTVGNYDGIMVQNIIKWLLE